MKRFLLVLLVAVTASAAPSEKWSEAYDRGVAAVNSKNYKLAAESLQKAIDEMPNEGLNVRAKKSLITYIPHFWLGIAKFNLGDSDGALREWRICEEQGVVARTAEYANMKNWIARAEVEKKRAAQNAAAGPKKAAAEAVSKAISAQVDAMSAGGDRTESYTLANQKLKAARAQFESAGTNVNAYKTAEQAAQQAATLFAAATAEGNRQKAARIAAAQKKPAPAPVRPAVQQAQMIPQPPAVKVIETPPPALKPEPAPTPVVSKAEAEKQFAEREAKRKQTEEAKKKSEAIAEAAVAITKVDLRQAWRAYAAGDLVSSEKQLTAILRNQPAAEAYLLRGCARYSKAMMMRREAQSPILMAATDDFRAALDRNRGLRLDRNAFSPKLVKYFEDIRKKR